MKQIKKRVQHLEKKEPDSELFFNCVSWDELTRMDDLMEKDQLTETESEELNRLYNKAKRDARLEFLDQYDKTEPFDLRTVFNDYKAYQLKHGRTSRLGYTITPAYTEFQKFLTNKGYQLK